MVLGFLHDAFIVPNKRTLSQSELVGLLEDRLYRLRQELGESAYPKPAAAYLDDWAADQRGWLRRYYPETGDEPHFDLTPAVELVIDWVRGLTKRHFVGTESRLMTVFELLQQIVEGAETDPEARIRTLERRRSEIDAQIAELREGRIEPMDPARLRDRFLQMQETARRLLADFRAVEQNFRDLDRALREHIASWEGAKGELLEEIFGRRDAITDSDEGQSFRAFWDFLMDPRRQEELGDLLERVLSLEPVRSLHPDPRVRRIHYDWLEAGEVTQRTVARLSEQLRRYLDDQAWLEDRRIMHLLRGIEQSALALREAPPEGPVMALDAPAPAIELVMERPLFRPPERPALVDRLVVEGEGAEAGEVLFTLRYVDPEELRTHIRRLLQQQPRVSLAEVVARHPLQHGLAELLAYLTLADADPGAAVAEDQVQQIAWRDAEGRGRRATVPLIQFCR